VLSPEARELLDVLRAVGFAAVDDLRGARDGEALDRALGELRAAKFVSVHLGSRGRRLAQITDAGRRA